ncbi:hypothetical protein C8A05DRAFT_30550 [Staphylotrichum tortipilum]|uniref:Uncharacterized protein n=1 Tax=Staphylotrichum tortipilum TaxID=2831512 RepID=A0AAN6MRL9_9PEZI|nr:hypothetical protein C8A05DRAFT_30550 [Staphylotrichum longicolle]
MCAYDKVTTVCIHCDQLLSVEWKKKADCQEPTLCWCRDIGYESRCLVACGCDEDGEAVDVMEEKVEKKDQEKDAVPAAESRGLKRKRSSEWLRRAAERMR